MRYVEMWYAIRGNGDSVISGKQLPSEGAEEVDAAGKAEGRESVGLFGLNGCERGLPVVRRVDSIAGR
ncbi:hypothetical protein O1611_g7134 [Lasiodiplodia mahajangana]|uniref:Uncharacterized protein n=1 Tax=Lasiodiplodia mahajangana TaxID=1108764 RepID=A0ACC2JGK6_9PEZI|nr:hypothetical protein O1611_g7134 [Lasiodiplodia mahajangana]